MTRRLGGFGLALLAAIWILAGCGGQMQQIKGDMRLQSKEYAAAVPFFEEALKTDPDNCPARTKLGFALLKSGRLDEAVTQLEKVLDMKPGEPAATLYLGIAYASREEIGKAIDIWRGYSNPQQPLIEAEIRRQLTLLQVVHGRRLAEQALADEARLGARAPDPNTVAVCYFEDLTPDRSLAAFQKGLAAMVISDLSKVESLRVVERMRLQALLAEMQLGQTGIVDARTAPRVGRLLGADKLIVGSLAQGSIETAMTLTSASSGSVLGTTRLSVPTDRFYTLPAAMIRALADIAGITLSPTEVQAIGIPQTTSLKAFTYFGQALDALDAGNWQTAKELFDLAVAEDPNFQLASEGSEGAPGAEAPGVEALDDMAVSQVAQAVESAVEAAAEAQSEADTEAEAAGGGDGGGGGY